MILLGEDSSRAMAWSRRFYHLLSEKSWACRAVTVSMGIAEVHVQVDDAAAIMRRADKALYRAKREGRVKAFAQFV